MSAVLSGLSEILGPMNLLGDEPALTRRIAAYLSQQVRRRVTVGVIRRFPVGFSWLTYSVPVRGLHGAEESEELILRLGPDYGLFAPYSAAPQVLAMQSLEGSSVPLPRAYWSSDDASIFGAPFMFCEMVSGAAVVPWVPAGTPPLEEGYRRRLGEQFIDTLAALHRFDWRERPIAALASGIDVNNAALRNVEHWEAQIARWAMRPYPLSVSVWPPAPGWYCRRFQVRSYQRLPWQSQRPTPRLTRATRPCLAPLRNPKLSARAFRRS